MSMAGEDVSDIDVDSARGLLEIITSPQAYFYFGLHRNVTNFLKFDGTRRH